MREGRAEWFRSLGMGLFVHWGPYSVLGRGEWAIHDERMTCEEYDAVTERFTASRFQPSLWVELAKAASMKYIVLTACHGDGYCLFRTKTYWRNAMDMTPGRDLVAEYVSACREGGLGVGLYYSMTNWYENFKRFGAYDCRTNPLEKEEWRERWRDLVDIKMEQLRELLTQYGPIDILWLDDTPGGPGALDLDAVYALVRSLQPQCLIGENNRGCGRGDFDIAEERFLEKTPERPWEMCMPLACRWGHHKGDTDTKSVLALLRLLRRCAFHGGNLLLNTGPLEDGSMQPGQEKLLRELGSWIDTQGESLFGCTPVSPGHSEWGEICSVKENTLYIHVDRWMGRRWAYTGLTNPALSATLLSTGESVRFRQKDPGRLLFDGLPDTPPNRHCNVIAVRTQGVPQIVPWTPF